MIMKKANILRLKFIDAISGLNIYHVLEMFRSHQYMPEKDLDKIRQEKLDELFTIAKQSSVYYSAFDSYKGLPVLTKKIMKLHPDHFLSKFYYDKLFKKATGGTTGTPFVYNTSVNAQSHLWAGLLLSWESAGYQFGDKVAFIAGSALMKPTTRHGIFYNLMNIDLYPASSMEPGTILKYVETIRQKKTGLIYGYAMAINVIADYIIENNIAPLPGLKSIVCTSEMLTDKMRANIEKAFGIKVYNQYGCNEAGVSAFECGHGSMHLISSRSVYETDKDGILISTDLANEAFIFMKYNTGDVVEFADEPCSCRRTYPVLKKIIGRCNDVIVDKKNKRIHSSYFNFLFKKDKSIKQYQVFFDENSIAVNLKVDNGFTDENYQHYLDEIKGNLAFDRYDIKTNEAFYSGSNAKHAFIIDKRKHDNAAA